jgi:hypothetical protein
MINFVDVKAGIPRFLSSVYTSIERHTVPNLTKLAIDVMNDQEGGIGGYVAVQGDNAADTPQ